MYIYIYIYICIHDQLMLADVAARNGLTLQNDVYQPFTILLVYRRFSSKVANNAANYGDP